MKKVIFIYGFTGTNKDSQTAKKVLDNYNLICFEYDSSLRQALEEISEELDDFIISKTKSEEKVDLIGVSAGGIIASYSAKFVSPRKIDKLATICSPLNGTYVPDFYTKNRKGLKELEYDSPFLKKLNSKKLGQKKIINFYSFFDYLVPGNSGKGENPIHTWNFIHFTASWDKRILNKTKEFFDKK